MASPAALKSLHTIKPPSRRNRRYSTNHRRRRRTSSVTPPPPVHDNHPEPSINPVGAAKSDKPEILIRAAKNPSAVPSNDTHRGAEIKETKTWNLRSRTGKNHVKSTPLMNSNPTAEKKEQALPKISISLTEEEIEEDFIKITNKKPPKIKRKKRSHDVRNYFDRLLPGGKLHSITPNSYKFVLTVTCNSNSSVILFKSK
ncbi:uncharacterized protein LOC127246833 [Andrographis paniculata]|uniref:uncharacterized protein LOC127246833 n=1 Tax=Andrographis paniculata TaxID=175694 RepID=UPI0021E809EA|nr:uncharacterized protein LOC127246833 [Andrographis paniculata]